MEYSIKESSKGGKPIYYLCVKDIALIFVSLEALENFKSKFTPEEAYEMTASL